jgi:lipopolysaccharide export LptBFGC system permease protein LptF
LPDATGALLAAVVVLCLAAVALARDPQRIAAALAVSLLFLLCFTGVGFVLVGLTGAAA